MYYLYECLILVLLINNNIAIVPLDHIVGCPDRKHLGKWSIGHEPGTSGYVSKQVLVVKCKDLIVETLDPEVFQIRKYRNVNIFLTDNRIKELHENIFNITSNIKKISLANNLISELPKGIFNYNKYINFINFSSNKIASIHRNLFIKNHRLEYIYFDNNKIRFLHRDTFINNQLLKVIAFDNNLIMRLHKDIFKFLWGIVTISFPNNKLSNIEKDLFLNNVRLITLKLHDNFIRRFDASCLRNARNLKDLQLHSNQMEQLQGNLTVLTKLSTFLIFDNKLTSFTKNAFAFKQEFTELAIQNNRFQCGCDMIWLLSFEYGKINNYKSSMYSNITKCLRNDGGSNFNIYDFISKNSIKYIDAIRFLKNLDCSSYKHIISTNHIIPIKPKVESIDVHGQKSIKANVHDTLFDYGHVKMTPLSVSSETSKDKIITSTIEPKTTHKIITSTIEPKTSNKIITSTIEPKTSTKRISQTTEPKITNKMISSINEHTTMEVFGNNDADPDYNETKLNDTSNQNLNNIILEKSKKNISIIILALAVFAIGFIIIIYMNNSSKKIISSISEEEEMVYTKEKNNNDTLGSKELHDNKYNGTIASKHRLNDNYSATLASRHYNEDKYKSIVEFHDNLDISTMNSV